MESSLWGQWDGSMGFSTTHWRYTDRSIIESSRECVWKQELSNVCWAAGFLNSFNCYRKCSQEHWMNFKSPQELHEKLDNISFTPCWQPIYCYSISLCPLLVCDEHICVHPLPLEVTNVSLLTTHDTKIARRMLNILYCKCITIGPSRPLYSVLQNRFKKKNMTQEVFLSWVVWRVQSMIWASFWRVEQQCSSGWINFTYQSSYKRRPCCNSHAAVFFDSPSYLLVKELPHVSLRTRTIFQQL